MFIFEIKKVNLSKIKFLVFFSVFNSFKTKFIDFADLVEEEETLQTKLFYSICFDIKVLILTILRMFL